LTSHHLFRIKHLPNIVAMTISPNVEGSGASGTEAPMENIPPRAALISAIAAASSVMSSGGAELGGHPNVPSADTPSVPYNFPEQRSSKIIVLTGESKTFGLRTDADVVTSKK
jgi:hypothetical protein